MRGGEKQNIKQGSFDSLLDEVIPCYYGLLKDWLFFRFLRCNNGLSTMIERHYSNRSVFADGWDRFSADSAK